MSKSINWLNLPDALWCKIFEYDGTYHKVYKNMVYEFLEKTMFWRIKWFNKNAGWSRYSGVTRVYERKYEMKRKNLDYILDYWNNHKNNGAMGNEKNCEAEYITDHFNKSKRVLDNLKALKGYLWNKEKEKLYKPHYKQRLKYSWRGRHLIMD